MTFAPDRIALAVASSIALHLGVLFGPLLLAADPPPSEPPPLEVRLKPPPPPAATPEPVFTPPETAEPEVRPPPPPPPAARPNAKPSRPMDWQQAAREQLKKLNAEGLLYSTESFAAGLQGTTVLLLVLDETGKVTATRIEESSGHPLLDRDARNAAMRLRFPPDAPSEIIYPIRFKLK